MLVLSRKRGERLLIHTADGQRIAIYVVRTYAGRAKIGIEAPMEFRVERESNK